MGPWTHRQAGNHPTRHDQRRRPRFRRWSRCSIPAQIELAWFDHWLKGIDNGAEREPPVKLFVMGANAWRDEQEWPLARTDWTPYYLHSGGQANTLHGDGALSPEPPGDEPADTYRLRPGAPGADARRLQLLQPGDRPLGRLRPAPDRGARRRARLHHARRWTQDLEVTGPIVVHLFAATDGPDTDFTAKLVDVFPDGTAWNLCDGIIRGRYRNGRGPAELLTPGRGRRSSSSTAG